MSKKKATTKSRKTRKATKRPRGNRKKPLVQAAVICESIIKGEDGVPSLIRVIDTFTLTGPAPQLPPGLINVNVYLAFKSGEAIGTRTLRISVRGPSGKKYSRKDEVRTIELKGEEHGASVTCDMHIGIKETGVYWIDAVIGRELMTSIPLRIRYSQTPAERVP